MLLVELKCEIDETKIQRVFSEDHILIGRSESNDLVLHDPRISSLHGQVLLRENKYFYQDLQSTNGSMVKSDGEQFIIDGVQFKEREILDGDQLLLGDVKHPVEVSVRLFEGEAIEDGDTNDNKTILASRAISDFSLLSKQIIDDKSQIRSLFRFQKETHEHEKAQDIFQHTALFLLNHIPNAEYVALHREDTISKGSWRQVYFTSKSKDVSADVKQIDEVLFEAAEQKRALLLDADLLKGIRLAGNNASPLGSMILAPLIQQEVVIGFIEIGNTKNSDHLGEVDLDFISVVSYVLSAKVVNLKLMEAVCEAEEKLKNENQYLKSKIGQGDLKNPLIGESAALKSVQRQIETVGASDLTVLIMGETGTGKELIAASLHKHSNRKNNIFTAVNCGTFSDTLLESELFGHVKGAFTGAVDHKKGLFEVADGGTMFLDEIGETPFNLQVKLLRTLQEGEVMPVGATKPKKVDVRVICATNKNMEKEVETGRFREDLYYRINTFPITIAPLRDRPDDIVLLAKHFLKMFSSQMRKFGYNFSDECMQLLRRCAFPGNVRQLKNEVQRALLMVEENELIEPKHFSPQLFKRGQSDKESHELAINGRTLKEMMEEHEIKVIRQALEDNEWNRSKTAQMLKISRQAFMTKLSKYSIVPNQHNS